MPSVTLRLFDSNGTFLSHLPLIGEVQIQQALNEEGAGTLKYSVAGEGAELLSTINDGMIAVNVDGTERFRFIFEDDEDDQADAAGLAREITVAGPGTLAMLARAVVLPKGGVGKRPATWFFDNATPGAILRGLIGAVTPLGYLPNVSVGFDATRDSAGNAWSKVMDITYDAGKDLLTVAKDLAAQGVCDIAMYADPDPGGGLIFHAWNPDTSLAVTQFDVYIRRAHVSKAPRKRSRKELTTDLLVVGDDGVNVMRSDPTAQAKYGKRLGYLGWGNATKTATLNAAGDNALALGSRPATGYDFDLQLSHPTCPQPFTDFRIGDKIRSDFAPLTSGGAGYEFLRVRAMTVSLDRDGAVQATIGCNDRFLESSIKLARKIDGVVHGSIGTNPSGTPTKPPPDKTPPAAPTGVDQAADVYTGPDGRSVAQAEVFWNAVTVNSDGSEYDDFGGYRVSYRLPERSALWTADTYTTGTDVVFDGLPQGLQFQARVRAVDAIGNSSAYGVSPLVTLPVDPGPPPPPSTPQLTARLGTLRVVWDGFDSAGLPMPGDFDHIEVHVSTTPGFTTGPSTNKDSVAAALGAAIFSDLEYDTTYYVKLVAVDYVGNRSTESAEASQIIVPLVDTDIIGEIIDGANIVDGTLVASDKIIANTITGGLIQALAIQAGHIAANAITADKIQVGAITTEKLAASAVTASKILAGTITADKLNFGTRLNLHPDPSFEDQAYRDRTTGASAWAWENSASSFDGMWRLKGIPTGTTTGFVFVNLPVNRGERYYLSIWMKTTATNGKSQLLTVWSDRNGNAVGSVSPNSATYTIGNTWRKIEGVVVVPSGAASMSVRVDMSNGASTGAWYWDYCEIRPIVGTTTTSEASRVEMSALGIKMYDETGRQTINMDPVGGDILLSGEIWSGVEPDRPRVNIAPARQDVAEVRFLPGNETLAAFINGFTDNRGRAALGLNAVEQDPGSFGNSVILASDNWVIGELQRATLAPLLPTIEGVASDDNIHFYGKVPNTPIRNTDCIWAGKMDDQVGTNGAALGWGITMVSPPKVVVTPFSSTVFAEAQDWQLTSCSATVAVIYRGGSGGNIDWNYVALRQ